MKFTQQFIFLSLCAGLAGCGSNTPEEPETTIVAAPQTPVTTVQTAPPTTVNVPTPAMPGAQTANTQSAANSATKTQTTTATTTTQTTQPKAAPPMPNDVAGLASRIRSASTAEEARNAWSAAYQEKSRYDRIVRSATQSNQADVLYAATMAGAYDKLMRAADEQGQHPGHFAIGVHLDSAQQLAALAEQQRQQAIQDAQNPQAAAARREQFERDVQRSLIEGYRPKQR